jgi:L-ascorbate metabolism protein UlaG (beta-lactamase superfamily)
MKITWLGHATVVIETARARLITDPVLRDRVLHLRRHSKSVRAPEPVAAVLVSHLHHDHLDLPSLGTIAAPVVGPRGTSRTLRSRREVSELKPGEQMRIADATVTAVRAVHDGRRWHLARRYDDDTLGFVVAAGGVRAYFAGDTERYDAMRELRPLDVALLPIWGWGTRLGGGHMDPAQAAAAVALLSPTVAIPIHWGTFLPLRAHRRHGHLLTEPAREFRERCAELAPGVRVEVIEPGGSIVIPAPSPTPGDA